MRIVAYCARQFAESTRQAAGVEPLTSPPYVDGPPPPAPPPCLPCRPACAQRAGKHRQAISGEGSVWAQFDGGMLAGADLVYFALHGEEWLREWLGDGGVVALRAVTLAGCELQGAVAFVENCYLPSTPMLGALFEAGCERVVGGSGQNFGGAAGVAGVSLMGRWFRKWLALGVRPELALQLGKARAMMQPGANRADIAEFREYRA